MTNANDLPIRAFMTSRGIPWPAPLPGLGSAFVEVIEFHSDRHESSFVQWGPPEPPERIVPLMWDDDGNVDEWRELSEAEYATAVAAFDAAMARWCATGGWHRIQGPLIPPRATFRTATGALATGAYASGAWHWLELAGIPAPSARVQKK